MGKGRLVLPLSYLFTSHQNVVWAARSLWLLLPFEILQSQLLVSYIGESPLHTFLLLFAVKLLVVLSIAGALWGIAGQLLELLWVRDAGSESAPLRKASFGHVCFWLMLVWLFTLGIWLSIELLFDLIAGRNNSASFLHWLFQCVSVGPFRSLYASWSDYGFFWGWFIPIAIYASLALLLITSLEAWAQPSRRTRIFNGLPLLLLIDLVFAFPLAAINSSAFCPVPTDVQAGVKDECGLFNQLHLAIQAFQQEPTAIAEPDVEQQ